MENNGKITATGSLAGNEISGVFVQPSQQSMGLGRKIMLELEWRAKSKGIHHVALDISLPSRSFYQSLQYEISGPFQLDVGEGQHLQYWQGMKIIGA